MPPQVYDLWPVHIRATFGDMHACGRQGDMARVARGCKRVEAKLKKLEARNPAWPVRAQIARSHYDLSFFYKDLKRLPAARRALERALERWQHLVKTKPGDFYARTQLGACHNLLALMAADAGDTDAAEEHYIAALEAREEAHNREVAAGCREDATDRCDNLTYRAGIMCNLAHLYRTKGNTDRAAEWYAEAIRSLEPMLPKHTSEANREVDEFFARQWESIHGQPHYTGVAAQFLENAKWGQAELKASLQGANRENSMNPDAELKTLAHRADDGNSITSDERCRHAAKLRQNWQQGGNSQKAEEIYRDAIRCYPDSWMAHFGLGEVLLFNAADAGQWSGAIVEEGIGHLKEAATLAPRRIEPLLKLANKLSVCDPPVKDMAAAKGYYRQAIDALPEEQEFLYPEVWQGGDHWEFACESARIGDTDIAVTAFAHAIRMNPTLYRTKFRPPDAAGVRCWLRAMERSG